MDSGDQGPVSLAFPHPVWGVGTQIESTWKGKFTAFVSAYDASNNSSARSREGGVSNQMGDNSAIFIGVSSTSDNIASVTFGLTDAPKGTTADFAINQVSLRTLSSPRALDADHRRPGRPRPGRDRPSPSRGESPVGQVS